MCVAVRWGRLSLLVFIVSVLIILLPLGLLWPLALHHTDPAFYQMWREYFFSKAILTTDPLASFTYYIGLLPWFSWPTVPMSLWTLWHYRHEWKERKWRVPVIFFLVLLVGLSLMESKDYLTLSLLIPLCLLAVGGLDSQIRGFASALNWFGMVSFLLTASLLWLFWFTLSFGFPVKLAEWLGKFEVIAAVSIEPLFVGYALFATVCWIYLLTRSGQLNRWAVIHWTTGVILAWTLLMSLLLPWLDWTKSYRYVAQDLQKTLQLYDKGCIEGQNLGANVKAAFHYFAGITTVENAQQCRLLLLQTRQEEATPNHATLLWTGSRYREHRERFYLYRIRERVSGGKGQ